MHILLVADGRSPTTHRWIEGLLAMQYQVTLVSTYPCPPYPNILATHNLPVAFSALLGGVASNSRAEKQPTTGKTAKPLLKSVLAYIRYLIGPLTLRQYKKAFQAIIKAVQPDLVHALRIPFEGMLAAYTPPEIPLLVSIWGNDLTLHAKRSRAMRNATLRTLQRADGLIADAQRDIRLGHHWGFAQEKPTLVVPGNGGIDLMQMNRPHAEQSELLFAQFPSGAPLIINPRGFRPGSVRNDIFFQSIPLVLERFPQAHFICTAMAGKPEAARWVEKLKIENNVHLLPHVPQVQLWELFRRSSISTSISEHDGTPNSLLEAMACGCFPIAGDIESLREWIVPGVNGLLVEPTKAQTLAEAIVRALENEALRVRAANYNRRLIHERAEVGLVRAQIQVFFQRVKALKGTKQSLS